ncbi:VanW family protein [Gracilibacillus caseinilyticus]|uniref:VanW family protein n=1 Tax=Gracilibacillus caseinilyticus TaxID=2932256 RepID=A0ABY4EY94_9BACI|nr:VanW family protein [Gracilibacillus caseinilyticus]UOQ48991.1 VanW family protein [Gracilibacillus caseinilyticus]
MKMTFLTILFLILNPVMVSNDIVITYKEKPVANVSRADLMVPFLDDPVLDPDKFMEMMEQMEQKIYQRPVDATINDNGAIVSGKVGYKLDRTTFKEMFLRHFFKNTSENLEVPVVEVQPTVDEQLLSKIRKQKIGQYVTYFNSNKKERAHNIMLAAEAINNHVVFPGGTFSFNKVVGKRTKERGYLPAPEIVKGELTEGIGGGICQVSSTLYNAIDRAGVQVLERYSHSKKVPYVPPGRDATVSWYGPDFTFMNNYNQPLLIRSKKTGGSIYVEVYTSDTVEISPRDVPSVRNGME